jgi:all-trans-retinol 13,14-reductase
MVPNPKLRAVLCAQWGYYGATPSRSSFGIHALVVRHYLNGGYYPAGGAGVIAESFLKTVRDGGGAAVVRAPVQEILVEGGRAVGVKMEDGREFRAAKVVSAAGAMATASTLVPEEYRSSPWARDIQALRQSPPHLCMYFGLEGDVRAAGATNANQWYFETWDMEVSHWKLSDPTSLAPVLYVSFPSLKDPLHEPGPQNRHTMEAVTFVSWEDFAKWKHTRRGNREKEYTEFKKSIEERMLVQMRKHVPELMKLVKHYELGTPLSTTFFTRAPQGAIYGLEPTPQRFGTKSLRTRTPIRGLYLAGADVATLGVTGALIGGILAAGTIEPRVLTRLK